MGMLELPNNIRLPFIAYGSFKPGELRFNLIKDYVLSHKPIVIYGIIREKDGIPLYKTSNSERSYYTHFSIDSYEITFKEGQEKSAYQIICDNEPNTFYKWTAIDEGNVLEGKRIKGAISITDPSWSFSNDPYFESGLIACESIANQKGSNLKATSQDHHHFFTKQAAYMLLWTIIERFCAIKYGNLSPGEKLKKLSCDDEIDWEILRKIINRDDTIVPSNQSRTNVKLNSNSTPLKSLNYYYSLRSNMVHRGKDVFSDIERIDSAFDELFEITKHIINTFIKRK